MKMEHTPNHEGKQSTGNDLNWLLNQPLETKLELFNHHLSLVKLFVNHFLEDEVLKKAGPRYSRREPESGYSRWGTNPGSVKVGDQRMSINVPRIYNHEEGQVESPESYKDIREGETPSERLMQAVLKGLSTRDYEGVIDHLGESFGLSKSSVSEAFRQRSAEALEKFENRDLSQHQFVGLFLDGKYLAKEQIIIALGVTTEGFKIPVGFIQTHTENHRSIKQMLSHLKERGLENEEGMLVVIDGSKGLYKAVKESFGQWAVIQRCRWHKREDVLGHLAEEDRQWVKARYHEALARTKYGEAKTELNQLAGELDKLNKTAARSLREGLEEVLTLHWLGLNGAFQKSFATTNCIESLNAQVDRYLKKVKRWKSSDTRYRWMAVALLEIEDRMRRVDNYRKIHLMQEKLKEEVQAKTENTGTQPSQISTKNRA